MLVTCCLLQVSVGQCWFLVDLYPGNSLFVVPVVWGCVGACAPWCGVFAISRGCVAVGWYPAGMWLLDGLGMLFVSFLHALSLWLLILQCEQKTWVLHSCHMCPNSPHLKQVGVYLFPDEFGESLKSPLWPVGLVTWGGKPVCVCVFVLLFFHDLLWPVPMDGLVRSCVGVLSLLLGLLSDLLVVHIDQCDWLFQSYCSNAVGCWDWSGHLPLGGSGYMLLCPCFWLVCWSLG